ncbi:MAG TPA: hypothetical protein VFW71_15795 [Actinomycetota bacterium]|nr:hypothetical protein [Actinomycetota bacterium]
MSLHGSQGPSQEKKSKRPSLGGGFRPAGGGGASGGGGPSRPTPSSPSASPPPSSGTGVKFSPFGGGSGAAGGNPLGKLWGSEPTGPGMTENWSDATRLGVAVLAFVLIAGALAALIFGIAKGGNKHAVTQTNTAPNVLTPFNPPTTQSGSNTDMPITFTDGTTGDLLYDPSLNLSALGVELMDGGQMGNFGRAGGQFEIDHGGASFLQTEAAAGPGVTSVPGPANSPVPVEPASRAEGNNTGNFLDFKFGDWRVGVWEGTGSDHMSQSDDAQWAANLSGQVTPSGWLILTGNGPVQLTQYGTGGGPSVVIGDIASKGMLITPGACVTPAGRGVVQNNAGQPVRINQEAGSVYEGYMCLGSNLSADIYGPSDFVNTATNTLQFTNVKPGPARPKPSGS